LNICFEVVKTNTVNLKVVKLVVFNLQVVNVLEAYHEVVKLKLDNPEGDVPGAEILYLVELVIMCI